MASPYREQADAAIAGLVADFVEAAPVDAPASPFQPVTAQTPRQRVRVQPNNVMAVNGAAFDSSIDALISNPSAVHTKPTHRMSEAEFRAHSARVFGGAEQTEETSAAKPRGRGSKLGEASDEQLEALEARLRDERDRRSLAAYTQSLADGESEVDDLSDLTDADDLPYGGIFEDFAETTPDEFLPYVDDETGAA